MGIITSKAEPTRNDISFQVRNTCLSQGKKEAATLLQGEDWNFIQHGELGRGENKVETKARLLNDHLRTAERGLLGQGIKMNYFSFLLG